MGKYSVSSIILSFMGLLLFVFNWLIDGYSEPVVLLGFISFIVGIALSFIAVAKQEKGSLKFVSLISFFVIMFLITWFEPFQVPRIITWIKNVS